VEWSQLRVAVAETRRQFGNPAEGKLPAVASRYQTTGEDTASSEDVTVDTNVRACVCVCVSVICALNQIVRYIRLSIKTCLWSLCHVKILNLILNK
jgi:hypothetical protein